jgi:hypothetical protein
VREYTVNTNLELYAIIKGISINNEKPFSEMRGVIYTNG